MGIGELIPIIVFDYALLVAGILVLFVFQPQIWKTSCKNVPAPTSRFMCFLISTHSAHLGGAGGVAAAAGAGAESGGGGRSGGDDES
jgi:hypothetical protein